MTQFTIDVADTFSFKRAGQIFTVDSTTMPAAIIADIVYHGFTQKIGDAAAGKDGDEAYDAMVKVYESLQKGNWGRERGVTTGPAWLPYAIAIVRKLLGADNKAAYDAIPSDDQKARVAFLTGLFDGLTDDQRAGIQLQAETAYDAAQAEKAREKAMLRNLGANIGL